MSKIYRSKNSGCIIRIYVADEFRFHLKCVVCFCPVLKCDIKSTRTKITSADTDLNNGGELLAIFIGDLTCMNLVCEVCSFFLLCNVEFTFVNAVYYYGIALLFTCKVVK